MPVKVFDYDAELISCAAGDSTAFLNLYNHEAPSMHALLSAMIDDPDVVNNLLHDIFVAIWRNAAGYSPAIGTARAWIYSILRYKALAWQKQQKSKYRSAIKLPELTMPSTAKTDKLPGALLSLPKEKLEVLLQAYLHGGSTSDIADQLNRSEPDIINTIETCLAHIDSVVKP